MPVTSAGGSQLMTPATRSWFHDQMDDEKCTETATSQATPRWVFIIKLYIGDLALSHHAGAVEVASNSTLA